MTSISRRSAVALGAGAPLALALPTSVRAQAAAAPQGAGFYRFRLGEMRCTVVSDGGFVADTPVQSIMAINAEPRAVEALLAERFQSAAGTIVHLNALLIESPPGTVLIDTGSSTAFGPTAGQLARNLQAAGVDPGSVDAIIISHAHPDHLFGALDGRGEAAFPKARLLIGEVEHGFWTKSPTLAKQPLPDAFKAQVIEGAQRHLASLQDRIELIQAEREVLPGITALATPGHTPGHLSFLVSSAGQQLFVTGDVVHHFALGLAHPEWQVAYDTDPEEAVITRRRVVDRVATDRLAVLAYHFPFPGLGHVATRSGGHGWEPIVWSWDPNAALG